MSKVFITKFQPDWDFTPASDFGTVEFITDKEFKQEPVIATYNDAVKHDIEASLKHYVPGEDFICFTASAVNNAVVAMTIMKKGPMHKFLRWNNHRKSYGVYNIRL